MVRLNISWNLSLHSTILSDVLLILDRNHDFIDINIQIRDYCKAFLDPNTHEHFNRKSSSQNLVEKRNIEQGKEVAAHVNNQQRKVGQKHSESFVNVSSNITPPPSSQ